MGQIQVYLANFTRFSAVMADSGPGGNQNSPTRGSDWILNTVVPIGFSVPANSISSALGTLTWGGTRWDWLYFSLVDSNGSSQYQAQAYFIYGEGYVVDVGPYSDQTSNNNPMPLGVWRGYGYEGSSVCFLLLDEDLPQNG